MTKEEKIKEAWGLYWDRLTEDQKEEALNNNGGVIIGYSEDQTKLFKEIYKNRNIFELEPCRPKSLSGIKNNNGWIKIESESDLPIDDKNDVFVILDEKMYLLSEVISLRIINNSFGGDITHYQPIQKPELPIY